ncbi:ribonuclease T2 [Flexibacterium corallicola]|uniref:ribonuclease T2 n=1 Tax=Flexibacterium corallicola TaxID=3037259 RepID=UPI00286F5442|nr:ribonuclease T2 [Pseudovibrio sp. M1P-2-3]
MIFPRLLVALGVVGSLAGPASAQIKMEGYFVAKQSCPAYQSFKKRTNPGELSVNVNEAYTLIGKNKEPVEYYQILIEETKPQQRWVNAKCGEYLSKEQAEQGEGRGNSGEIGSGVDGSPAYVLAASWQPSFCETRPSKTECKTQNSNRFDASNLVLHGLWPQPRGNVYCGVSDVIRLTDKNGNWKELPKLKLSEELRKDLEKIMPGYASYLHRHEWYKHGTCYGSTAQQYFDHSLDLMEQLNLSAVNTLFSENIGDYIGAEDIRNSFDEAFGQGAGAKVEVDCDVVGGRRLIGELRIHLQGTLNEGAAFADLLENAPSAKQGCSGGIVDEVGLGN